MNTNKNIIDIAKDSFENQGKSILSLGQYLTKDFEDTVNTIHSSSGRVIVSGIGKSAIIGMKIVATLNSTGTPAIFMHAADAIHGDLKQIERDKVMRAFKKETLQLLVATDIAARGIDIEGLAYVVHYQLPDKDEYYTHRSGRTARAGKEGVSLSLVTSYDMKQLRFLEKTLKISFRQINRVG